MNPSSILNIGYSISAAMYNGRVHTLILPTRKMSDIEHLKLKCLILVLDDLTDSQRFDVLRRVSYFVVMFAFVLFN